MGALHLDLVAMGSGVGVFACLVSALTRRLAWPGAGVAPHAWAAFGVGVGLAALGHLAWWVPAMVAVVASFDAMRGRSLVGLAAIIVLVMLGPDLRASAGLLVTTLGLRLAADGRRRQRWSLERVSSRNFRHVSAPCGLAAGLLWLCVPDTELAVSFAAAWTVTTVLAWRWQGPMQLSAAAISVVMIVAVGFAGRPAGSAAAIVIVGASFGWALIRAEEISLLRLATAGGVALIAARTIGLNARFGLGSAGATALLGALALAVWCGAKRSSFEFSSGRRWTA